METLMAQVLFILFTLYPASRDECCTGVTMFQVVQSHTCFDQGKNTDYGFKGMLQNSVHYICFYPYMVKHVNMSM